MLLALLAPGQPAAFPSFPDFIPLFTVGISQAASQAHPTLCCSYWGLFWERGTLVLASPALSPPQELHLILEQGAQGAAHTCPARGSFPSGCCVSGGDVGLSPRRPVSSSLSWQPAGFGFPWAVSTSHSEHFALAQAAVPCRVSNSQRRFGGS